MGFEISLLGEEDGEEGLSGRGIGIGLLRLGLGLGLK
jgi:hypothetical protein